MSLVSWLQLAALPIGDQTKGWDIKRWRYRLFATAGKITTWARKNHLLLPRRSPEHQLLNTLIDDTARLAGEAKAAIPIAQT